MMEEHNIRNSMLALDAYFDAKEDKLIFHDG